jgi:uncharacterized BrkB/YihY/UPF0761 family membrane protein
MGGDFTVYCRCVIIYYNYRWQVLAGREESEWQQKKMRLMLTILLLVFLSAGLVLGAVSHVWTKDRSVPNTHSDEHSAVNIHGNNFTALQIKLCTLIPT